jgi:hypothetical protein
MCILSSASCAGFGGRDLIFSQSGECFPDRKCLLFVSQGMRSPLLLQDPNSLKDSRDLVAKPTQACNVDQGSLMMERTALGSEIQLCRTSLAGPNDGSIFANGPSWISEPKTASGLASRSRVTTSAPPHTLERNLAPQNRGRILLDRREVLRADSGGKNCNMDRYSRAFFQFINPPAM